MNKLKVYLSKSNKAVLTIVNSVEKQLQLIDYVQIFKYTNNEVYNDTSLRECDLVVVVPPPSTLYGKVTIGKGVYKQIELALKLKKPIIVCNYQWRGNEKYVFCANEISIEGENQVDEGDWNNYADLSYSNKQTCDLDMVVESLYKKTEVVFATTGIGKSGFNTTQQIEALKAGGLDLESTLRRYPKGIADCYFPTELVNKASIKSKIEWHGLDLRLLLIK